MGTEPWTVALIAFFSAGVVAVLVTPVILEMRSRSRDAAALEPAKRPRRAPRWFVIYVIGVVVAEIALMVGIVAAAASGHLALAITAVVVLVLVLAVGGRLASLLVRLLRRWSDHAQ